MMNPLFTAFRVPAAPGYQAATPRPEPGGPDKAGTEGRTKGFEGVLATLSAGEAEIGTPGSAREVARLRAAGLHNEMLANLLNLGGNGESQAASLVERANLEALLSSGRFGNLLGRPGLAGAGIGQVLNARELNSWRQKNGPLSLGRPAAGLGTEGPATGPGQAYLVRPPQRQNLAHAEGREIRPEQPAAASPALSQVPATVAPAVSDQAPAAAAPFPAGSLAARPAVEPPAGPNPEGEAGQFTLEQLDKLVQKVALALNMDPHLIKAVIKAESNFNTQAVSKVGAKGLMQLMPGTAKELGVKDPFNPVENVWGGARYLKKMLDRHSGNINNALASYNWGPGNFDRHGGLRLPGETKRYISTVTKHYARLKQNSALQA